MKRATLYSAALVGLGLALGSTGVMAKAHDQGVADGTRIDPSALRGGVVAGVNTPGIGSAAFGGLCSAGFCGVVGDPPTTTYGQSIVSQQRAADIRRVKPFANCDIPPGQRKDGCPP